MSPSVLGVAVLVAVGVAVVATLHATSRSRAAKDRNRIFDDVRAAVEGGVLVRRGDGYPELRGTVDGNPVRLRVLVDALVLRTLPVLWLEVVVPTPVPVPGSVSVLLRPHGAEYFSPNGRLPVELSTPASFPRTARVAASTPDAGGLDLLEPLAGHIGEPETKEIGVGPGGLRSVRLLASADQGAYRVSRRASFTGARVAESELRRTVGILAAVARGVTT